MKFYAITLRPESGFGTPFKGDTLFGHFCWHAAYHPELLDGGLPRWVSCYAERPFAVFSSAWPSVIKDGKTVYALKIPDLPLSLKFPGTRNDRSSAIKERKERARQKWILVGENLVMDLVPSKFRTDEDIIGMVRRQALDEANCRVGLDNASQDLFIETTQAHNSINRLTMTTGKRDFAPFPEKVSYYYPETDLVVFVLIDPEATDIERLTDALSVIGRFGFGRNASTGLGRFSVIKREEKTIPAADKGANACYLLAPTIPEPGIYKDLYFSPFIRFGKHGDRLASSKNPFRNPVIMASEGAVMISDDQQVFKKPYLGQPAFGTSKVMAETIVQGYAPYLPFRLES